MNATPNHDGATPPQPHAPTRATPPKSSQTPDELLAKRRAKTETARALEAYGVYERLGPQRSFPAAANALKASDPQHYSGTVATLARRLKQWATDHGWQERARAYDLASEQAKRDAIEAQLARMNEEQALQATIAQRDVFTRLKQLRDLDQSAINAVLEWQNLLAQGLAVPDDVKARANLRPKLVVPAHVLAAHLRDLIDVERLARGAATEIAQQQHAGGIRISIVTAPAGELLDESGDLARASATSRVKSPFAQDPNKLLAEDESGYTADDDEDDESDETSDESDDEHGDDDDDES